MDTKTGMSKLARRIDRLVRRTEIFVPGYVLRTIRDVDLVEGTVSIHGRWFGIAKEVAGRFEEPKTSKSRRTIRLPPTAVRELASHRRLQLEERIRLGPADQNFDLVFATEIGTPILTSNLTRRHFKPILRKAGLPKTIRLYDLRHTCATLLLQANTSPRSLPSVSGIRPLC